MEVPQGVVCAKPNQVFKLHKSLYGLKQASRQWFAKLSSSLHSLGYKQSQHDHFLFTKRHGSHLTALLVYVDDLILAGTDSSKINSVKLHLDNQFKIKDLGTLKYFLGLEVARYKRGITIYQQKYALDVLSDAGLLASKPVPTPMARTTKLHVSDSDPFPDAAAYRKLVGRLLYLTNTIPNISFSVQQLRQFMSSPTVAQHTAATRVLRYIKGTPGQGLFYPSSSSTHLKAFSYSDWASCSDTHRSVTGYCVFLGDSLVSWKPKKQTTVSHSSSEAEYMALVATVCEIQWATYSLNDLSVPITKPASLFCNNQSARRIAANSIFHERTKHLEIDCHLVQTKLQEKLFHFLPISTTEQVADILTKPLEHSPFQYLLTKLGVIKIHSLACGGVLDDK